MDQAVSREILINTVNINSVDDRGFYICASGMNGGTSYLYNDGVIREGVNQGGKASAFWKTKKAAKKYFSIYKDEKKNKL